MTKALFTALFLMTLSLPAASQTTREVEGFFRATKAMQAGDWRAALMTAESISPVQRDIIEWHRLRAGRGDFDSAQRFLARRSDWPGLQLLRKRSESELPIGSRSEEVLQFFASEPPQTGAGSLALVEAYVALGKNADADAEAVRAWLTQILSAADETRLVARYGSELKPHHAERLDMLLWRGADEAAKRMYPRLDPGQKVLAEARLALRSGAKGVDTLIEAIPTALGDDAGLAFERMQWRARKGRNEDAIKLILDRSPNALGEAERWAGWRNSLARVDMQNKRTDRAYSLASQHGLTSGSRFAELEWLSGYLALTYKKDAELALRHFLRFRGAVDTPISLGRAGYWEGRAHAMLGDTENAQLAWSFGAEYQTSFYGLLAAEAAGVPLDPTLTGITEYPDWRQTRLAGSSVFEAARIFLASGDRERAEQFLTHLTDSLTEAEIGSLGDFLLTEREPHLAVMIAKQAARRGLSLPKPYFPVVDLGIVDVPVPLELALSIARRESEFDPSVMSGAGARGLMQLMPGTAKDVAIALELPYSITRLISDPAYNARLGTAYLDELMAIFDGNIIMVAAGYNAGPGRPMRWMNSLGDPRRGDVDVVDWIEHIPFDETRNYVMRVAESLPVYRARLTGQTGPVTLLAEMTSMSGYTRQAKKGEILRPRARPLPLTD